MIFNYFSSIFLCSCSIILFASVRDSFGEIAQFLPCTTLENSTCDVSNVAVDPCPEALENEVCTLYRGTNITISLNFVPHFSTSKLNVHTYSRVLLIDIPDIDDDHDGCGFTTCPIEAGKQYNFKYSRHVKSIYPPTPFLVKWRLSNALNDNEECCFLINVNIA